MVAYAVDNDVARQLYRDAGFVEQGLAPWGETMACLMLPEPSHRSGRSPERRAGVQRTASRRRIAGFGSSLQYL